MGTVDDLARGLSIQLRVDKSEYRSVDAHMFYGEITITSRFRNLAVWKATVKRLDGLRAFDEGGKEEILDAMIEEVQQLEERVKTMLEDAKTKDLAMRLKDEKIERLEAEVGDLRERYVEPLEALLR